MHDVATNAFRSHIKAYTTHPTQYKGIFNVKRVHLGHIAKSFGLRDAPSSGGGKREEKEKEEKVKKRIANVSEFGSGMMYKRQKK